MRSNVIVIGAGISGLATARALAENHFKVTIVEARSRVGGRINTRHGDFPVPIEEGAEFIHGDQPLTNALLREAQGSKYLLNGKRYQVWDGHFGAGEFFDEAWDQFSDVLAKLDANVSLADFLDRHFSDDRFAVLRRKVRAFAEGYDGANLDQVSALALRDEWMLNDDDFQYHIDGGYSTLIRLLESRVRENGGSIVLNAPVEQVAWSQGKVKVTCRTGDVFEGDKLVVTIPVGAMQQGGIAFSPSVATYRKAYQSLGFGGVIKIFTAFDTAFWEHAYRRVNDVAFIFSDASVPTWWLPSPKKPSVLTGWLAGPRAEGTLGRDEMHERSVQSLAYIFGCTPRVVRDHLTHWDMVNWSADPFSCGAYAFPTTRTAAALEVLSAPIEDTLYFAGEGLYHGRAIGTVEAALTSAQRTAALLTSALHNTSAF